MPVAVPSVEIVMAREARLKRASFFIDVRALRRARNALGAPSDAETVRLSVEHVAGSSSPGASRRRDVRWAILDTDLYIGNWERGDFAEALDDVRRSFIIRSLASAPESKRSLLFENQTVKRSIPTEYGLRWVSSRNAHVPRRNCDEPSSLFLHKHDPEHGVAT